MKKSLFYSSPVHPFVLNVCSSSLSLHEQVSARLYGAPSQLWRVCHSLGHAHECVPKPGPGENKGCARVLVKQAAHAPRRKITGVEPRTAATADLHVRSVEERSGLLNPGVARGWRAELRRRKREETKVDKTECLQLVLSAVENLPDISFVPEIPVLCVYFFFSGCCGVFPHNDNLVNADEME